MLYHGTVEKFLPFIREEGLKKGARHHVHLSPDMETARRVGQRRGKPIVLKVESGRMHQDGQQFFRSENGVWLTEHVPPEYLIF
jgi:putative RNA 2'-phosphotransferase